METPLGRQSLFLDRYGDGLNRKAYAFVPQSTVGDLLNMVLLKVYRQVPWVDLLLQVHDSFVIQVDDARIDEAIQTILPLFEIPLQINNDELIIPTGVAIGKNWGEMKEVKI